MKPKRPSPAMVVSIAALVMATTGSAIAAVDFARNAGAVDGKSAVASGATLKQATGKLVATQRTGPTAGRIAGKYLDLSGLARGVTSTFGKAFDVVDNATGAPVPIGAIAGLGTFTATCIDQDQKAGVEDPSTTLAFNNTSPDNLNYARTLGTGATDVSPLLKGAQAAFTITGSNTFTLHIEHKGVNYFTSGVVRQDGKGTAGASCLVYGFALGVAS